MSKLITKIKTRLVFLLIKGFSLKIKNSREIKELISNTFLSFKARKFKHSFNWWKINHFKLEKKLQIKEFEFTVNQFQMLNLRYQNSKKNTIRKSLKIINNKQKLKILRSWNLIKTQIKAIKRAKEKFEKTSESLKLKFGLNEIIYFTKNKIRKKVIIKNLKLNGLQRLNRLVFGH